MDLVRSLKAATAASYKLAPAAVLLMIAVVAMVVGISLWSSRMMMGVVLIIVWAVSLLVYIRTDNFGEAALAMVAGLLTVYSVEWTPLRFIAFCVAWVGFAAVALLIASMKVAASTEEIYMGGAVFVAPESSQIKGLYSVLRAVGKKTQYGQLGPIGRAEIVRFFCFRRVPIEMMRQMLQTTENVSISSRIDPLRVAAMFADFSKIHTADSRSSAALVDAIDTMLKRSSVPPEEFVTAFENSRHMVLGRRLAVSRYFQLLQEGLESGVSPQNMSTWLEERA